MQGRSFRNNTSSASAWKMSEKRSLSGEAVRAPLVCSGEPFPAAHGWLLELTLVVSFGGICSWHTALQNQIKNKHLNHISCLETLIMGAKVKPSTDAEFAEFTAGEHGCQSAARSFSEFLWKFCTEGKGMHCLPCTVRDSPITPRLPLLRVSQRPLPLPHQVKCVYV